MRYLVDTNVISEFRKISSGKANKNVVAYFSDISPTDIYISVITFFEIEKGIQQIELRDQTQGAILRDWLENHVIKHWGDNILPVDTNVAAVCASLHVPDPKSLSDSFIASTAIAHGLTLVTRNTKDFEKIDVPLVNPFQPD